MKNISVLLAITIALFSCKKEILQENSFRSVTVNSQVQSSNKSNTSLTIENVTNYEDMLWFQDFESFYNAIDRLDEFQANDIKLFDETYVTTTEE
jgi:hypothetical protein